MRKDKHYPKTFRTYTEAMAALPPRMCDLVPESEYVRGGTYVEHFDLSKEEAAMGNLRNAMGGDSKGYVEPGRYAKLVVDGTLMMTDTLMERCTNAPFLQHAHGDVLVAGLGLGMIVHALVKFPEVRSISIIEIDAFVVEHVTPTLPKAPGLEPRIIVHQNSIFEWEPYTNVKYNTIFFDIWSSIGGDNWEQMKALRKRYRKWVRKDDPDAWVGSWREDDCQRMAREDRRDERIYSWR